MTRVSRRREGRRGLRLRPIRSVAVALLGLALWIGGTAAAEGWTVQTVAVRDLRLGDAIASELVTLGFDAYTEFVMSDGQQWVRVRVGCYVTREDAEHFADLLRGFYTREAVVVPRSPDASPTSCLRREIGFVTPDRWRQLLPDATTFEVEVDGVVGLVRYQGDRWQLLQRPATETLDPLPATDGPFTVAPGVSVPFVARSSGEGTLRIVCAGRLLAQTSDVAIVEHQGVVSACRLVDASADDAGTNDRNTVDAGAVDTSTAAVP